MPSNDTIDVRALLDSRPVGRWQKWMILLCFLVVGVCQVSCPMNHAATCPLSHGLVAA